jgi:HK97 family phage portal protein
VGLLDRLTGRQARDVVATQSVVSAYIADEAAARDALQPATPRAALGLATAFRCVTLYATSTTQAGVIVERANRREPLPDWLRRPDAYGSDVRLRGLVEYLTVSMAGWGAGYLDAAPVGRTSWSLRTIDPARVSATISPLTGDRQYAVDGRRVDLAHGPARLGGLLVVPFLTVPGIALPLGPLSAARLSMGEYLEVERYAGRIFSRGTVSGGRLETDVDITEATAQRWASSWADKRATGSIPVLGAGLRYVNDVINPADAQWIQSREFDAQEVARWFGVPPRYLGLPSGDASTYATARDNDAALMRFGVAGYADSIGEALSTLLPPGRNELEDERVRLDLDALLRGTIVDRVDVWAKALQAGWLTVDEVRASEGLDPIGEAGLPAGTPVPSLPTAPGQVSVS